MSVKIQKPKLLIVEGRDDQLGFEAALRDHLGLTDIQVVPIGGKTLLTRNRTGLISDPDFATVKSLTVVRDADATTPGARMPSAALDTRHQHGPIPTRLNLIGLHLWPSSNRGST